MSTSPNGMVRRSVILWCMRRCRRGLAARDTRPVKFFCLPHLELVCTGTPQNEKTDLFEMQINIPGYMQPVITYMNRKVGSAVQI